MANLAGTLRQILAVLEAERQALAGMDLELILGCAAEKRDLCGAAEGVAAAEGINEECRALLAAARRRNEVNRQTRNLIAANVAQRLDSLTGAQSLYSTRPATALLGSRA